MEIKKVTLYITEMPLVIPFAASYGTYERRESIVVELEDKDGYVGFGEVVAFSGTVVYGRNAEDSTACTSGFFNTGFIGN